MSESLRTYQARPEVAREQSGLFDAYASPYGLVERTLFARIEAGDDRNALKRDFQRRFGITARQFNAAPTELGGTISSVKGRQPELIDDLKRRIKKAGGGY